ncbi:MAG: hypothetical protein V1912_01270 [bacterium]
MPWILVGLTCLAVALGIYSAAFRPPADRVIVNERVIERQVTAAVQATATPEGRGDSPTMTDTTTSATTLPADGGGTDSAESPGATAVPAETTVTSGGADPGTRAPDGGTSPGSTANPGSTSTSAAPVGEVPR